MGIYARDFTIVLSDEEHCGSKCPQSKEEGKCHMFAARLSMNTKSGLYQRCAQCHDVYELTVLSKSAGGYLTEDDLPK